jgi:hypothetical protein
MKIKVFLLAFIFLFFIAQVSATCTISFTKSNYAPTESILATMSCSSGSEKNLAYTVNWTNASGSLILQHTGITPNVAGNLFYDSYTLPSNYFGKINATLYGTGLTTVTTSGNVTGASANALVITNVTNSGKWLGTVSSTRAIVKDENGKKITGALCHVHILSPDRTQVLFSSEETSLDGDVAFTGVATFVEFKEATDYTSQVHCYCDGNSSSMAVCIDEDGIAVTNSVGSTESSFRMNQWVNFQDNMTIAYQNGSLASSNAVFYAGYGNSIFYYSNKTNNFGTPLTVQAREFLINNETGLNGLSYSQDFSIKPENTSILRLHELALPPSVPTGNYYIRTYFDVYYQNNLVTQYIMTTNTFRIVGTLDSFTFNNVVMDKSNYYTGSQIHMCANITSNYSAREEFEISYRYRCGQPTDSTGNALIDSYTEVRGINPGNQLRCADLHIPYDNLLLYKTSECQAIVTIQSSFINTFDNKISLQGQTFNITDFGMYPIYEKNPAYPIVRLLPEWKRYDNLIDNINRSYFESKINISKIDENILDPSNIIGDADWDVYAGFTDNMPCSTDVYNYSVEYANGTKAHNPIELKALQWVDKEGILQRKCSIGIENVNFSNPLDDYWVVKVWFEDFTERQTNALEGINNSQSRISSTIIQINSSLINMNGFLSSMNITNFNGVQLIGTINTSLVTISNTLTNATGFFYSISNWLSDIRSSILSLVGIHQSINSSIYNAQLYLYNIDGDLVASNQIARSVNDSIYSIKNYIGSLDRNISTIANNSNALVLANNQLYLIANYQNGSMKALQEIANKTGTFRMIINCPTEAPQDGSITCQISAQVEDTELVQKEVDFTCYLKDSVGTYSISNFNKMINRNISIIDQTFAIPSTFSIGSIKQVFCEASYYNLGSRTDTFFDSFRVIEKNNGDLISSSDINIPEEIPKVNKTLTSAESVKINEKGFNFMWIYLGIFIFIIALLVIFTVKKIYEE